MEEAVPGRSSFHLGERGGLKAGPGGEVCLRKREGGPQE